MVTKIESSNDITVAQWMKIQSVITDTSKKYNEIEKAVMLLTILYGFSKNQINSLPYNEVNGLVAKIAAAGTFDKPEKLKYIEANGKRYKPIYDPNELPQSSIISLKLNYLPKTPDEIYIMLPYLVARMVQPMKKTLFGWKVLPHDQRYQEDYTEDLREAKLGHAMSLFIICLRAKLSKDKEQILRHSPNSTGIKEMITRIDSVITALDSI